MSEKKAPKDPEINGISRNKINGSEGALDFSSDSYKAMLRDSLLSMGSTARFEKAVKKAEAGKAVTIAFIGGSITQGAGAEPQVSECYAYKTFRGFTELFSKNGNVRLCKAGIGGTPSEFGVFRAGRDVLRCGDPDVVIIEFAVNDDIDETDGVAYESLVRRFLNLPSKPAVILLFALFMDDFNLQEKYGAVGRRYGLPMVSVKNAVSRQFNDASPFITRDRFFFDFYHPSNDGHTIMADCLINFFKTFKDGSFDDAGGDCDAEGAPLWGASYENGFLIDKKDNPCGACICPGSFTGTDNDVQLAQFDQNDAVFPVMPYNMMYDGTGYTEDLTMELYCKNLVVMFKDTPDESFTKAEVYVDDKFIRTLDPHENDWIHCNTKLLINESKSRLHHIRITIPEGYRDKKFTIQGFGATD